MKYVVKIDEKSKFTFWSVIIGFFVPNHLSIRGWISLCHMNKAKGTSIHEIHTILSCYKKNRNNQTKFKRITTNIQLVSLFLLAMTQVYPSVIIYPTVFTQLFCKTKFDWLILALPNQILRYILLLYGSQLFLHIAGADKLHRWIRVLSLQFKMEVALVRFFINFNNNYLPVQRNIFTLRMK